MATAPATTIDIDFDAIEGKSSAPPSSTELVLSSVKTGEDLKTFSARSFLNEKQLATVKEKATKLYPLMVDQRKQLIDYGVPALQGVNDVVARMLEAQAKLKIPEVQQYLKEMDDAVDGFQRKYALDPKFREAIDRWVEAVQGFFNIGRDILKDLYRDSKTTVERLDRIAGKVVERQDAIDFIVALCDELYVESEGSLIQLLGVVAILEEIRDMATAELETLKSEISSMPEGTPAYREKTERRDQISTFVGQVEVQLNEFIQQYFLAGSTSAQVRNMQRIGVGLSQRLQLLVNVTINSALKKTIALWGTLLQEKEAGKVITTIDDAHNKALQTFAAASAESIPELAAIIQRPSTSPETIMLVAGSIQTQNKGIAEAFRLGQQQRAAVVDAVVRGSAMINASAQERDKVILDLITQANKPLEFVAAPIVPDAVVEESRLAITA